MASPPCPPPLLPSAPPGHFNNWLQTNQNYPDWQSVIESVESKYRMASSMISDLTVCINASPVGEPNAPGCPWTGPLEERDRHMEECIFVKEECPLCGRLWLRGQFDMHKEACATRELARGGNKERKRQTRSQYNRTSRANRWERLSEDQKNARRFEANERQKVSRIQKKKEGPKKRGPKPKQNIFFFPAVGGYRGSWAGRLV
eukprot:1092164-Rhodomonas_salina.1